MEGMIQGGWSYVAASYIVVWGGMIAYVAYLYQTRKRVRLDAEPNQE